MPTLRGPTVADVTDFIAARFVQKFGLESCVVYLYDKERVKLVASACRGGPPSSVPSLSLDGGAVSAGSVLGAGRAGRSFSLPLWDSRRLLGVVHGRLPDRRRLDEGFLELGRALAQGGAIALSVALLAETQAAGRLYGERKGETGPLAINPYLFRCLDSAVGRAAPERPVSIALLRLGRVCVGPCLPVRGRPVPLPGGGEGGWGFGFDTAPGRVALMWPETSRRQALEVLTPVAKGLSPPHTVIGCSREDCPRSCRPKAVALCVCPEDAPDAAGVLAVASDFLDVQTYLTTLDTEGRDGRPTSPPGRPAAVMDSRVLAAEIDRLRLALAEAVADGCGFQDVKVRDTSERLDHLIVVMQRFMSHRGAVPERC